MKLIDADRAIHQAQEPTIYDLCDTIDFLKEQPIVDGVHAAGGCYCKECTYHENESYPDGEREIHDSKECWCNWWDNTVSLNGFCSEGRKDDMKNA